MATEDKREAILERLLMVLGAIEGIKPEACARNKEDFAENLRPAIGLFDADEMQPDNFSVEGRGRPPVGQLILEMQPEVFIVVQKSSKEVGAALNELRAAVIKAVMSDTELRQLCHQIIYAGFTPALAAGRGMVGQGRVHFSFQYLLRIDKL